jgi:hypothetical protein
MRYIFGECTLDMQRDALRRAGRVSRRRRNAFQVLAYLLAHPTESSPSRSCANRSGRSSSSAMQRWRVRSKPCASRFGKAPGLNVSSNLSTAMTIAGLWRWRPTPMPGPTSPTRPARRRRSGGRSKYPNVPMSAAEWGTVCHRPRVAEAVAWSQWCCERHSGHARVYAPLLTSHRSARRHGSEKKRRTTVWR